ncbi:MAG TPA: putative baseplate assembly protein [Motilibacterales bacterium]|nr:putative baseplate assembly protein [Motilibacterales bacterium]
MALTSPILDDRSFEQLRAELLQRIPVYTREWTDHNESDPGIALLELFAFLGESVLYRFNQIPETTKIEFLRLLGVRPRPAAAATAVLAATTELAASVAVPRGSEIRAGSVVFSTTGATQVWPLDLVAVGKTPAPEPDPTALTASRLRAETDRRSDALSRAGLTAADPATFYVTTPVPLDPLAPGAQPLDVDATLDHAVWIAVLRRRNTDLAALADRSLFVGVAFDEQVPRPFALQTLDAAEAARYASPDLTADPPAMLWRLWQGVGKGLAALDIGDDTTRGLVTTGVVEVLLPHQLPVIDPTVPSPGDADNPPPLDEDEQAADVIAWIQVSRPPSEHLNDGIKRIAWIGPNAVAAEQARTATTEKLPNGTGDPDQVYPLAQHPVLAGTMRLQVEESGVWQDWSEVDSYVVSGPEDRHFAVDHEMGAVHFGGAKVPQLGERIRVYGYRFGGGLAGNVAAGTLTGLSVGGVKITNPLPATGGADAASLTEALDAIPADVHRRDRAVVAEDFRDLALQVTGVSRAETLPLLHPDNPAVPAAGVVSVVVFPTEDLTAPQAPLPGLGLLTRVARYLDVRRLVTTELYIIPPSYRQVAVSIGLAVRSGYQVDAVRQWVDRILRQYLGALPPSGPDGAGWPLGRAVRIAELEAVAVQVEGVEYIVGSQLGIPDGSGGFTPETVVTLARWEVPELAALTVVSGPPAPVGDPVAPANPGTLVPLPPDVC